MIGWRGQCLLIVESCRHLQIDDTMRFVVKFGVDAERWFLYGSASAGHGGSLISVIFYLSLRMDQRINIEIYRITEQMQTSRARQLKSP